MYEPTWRFPTTVDELSAMLRHEDGARIIAGGTDLAVRIRSGEERPAVLVDVGRVEELSRVSAGERVEIGATTTHARIAGDPTLAAAAPVLAEACRAVGSPQIRSRGTIGGNIANASPAADGVTALLALDAEVTLGSSDGRRQVALADFLVGPGATSLRPAESVLAVSFDRPAGTSREVYLKAGRRNAMAIAIVSVAAVYEPAAGSLKIALGSVAPTAVRATAAERLFEEEHGGRPTPRLIEAVAEEAVSAASCIDDVRGSGEYRTLLVRALTERALEALCLS